MCHQAFRKRCCYTERVSDVMEAHGPSLTRLYAAYAEVSASSGPDPYEHIPSIPVIICHTACDGPDPYEPISSIPFIRIRIDSECAAYGVPLR